jgi:hypothetical protein
MKKINALILAGMLSMPIYAEKMLIETGIGVNYGGSIGANISKPINSEIELFVGSGIFSSNVGYTAGSRYYISNSTRLIVNYGTNTLIGEATFEGLNFGADYFSTNGWAIGLMYSKVRVSNIFKQSPGKIGISLGYRW